MEGFKMTKLKTLKELEHIEDLKHQDSKLVYSWKLKQEAIKWVKEMKADMPDGKTPKEVKEIIIGMNGAINWIKHFFNLTEEDLK